MADCESVSQCIAYYGEDERFRNWILEAVARLPQKVCDFACDRCMFLSVGRSVLGMVVPARIATHAVERRTRNMWLILLEEDLTEEDAHSIIAHEIAHAWLRHDRLDGDPDPSVEEAVRQVKQWGFTGLGADEELQRELRMADLESVADGIAYYGKDKRLRTWIVDAVARLPQKVCDFVCDRCRFLSVGCSALGMVVPARIATHAVERRTRNMWLILLEEDLTKQELTEEELTEEDAHSIIAHEIAHAWLRHDRHDGDPDPSVEIEAVRQVQQWGFTGLGADEELQRELWDMPQEK